MSSDRWPSVKTIGGILSADPNENPHFADANHVYVPYCSSDSWSGTQKGSNEFGQQSYSFMGSYIVREVIKELADYNQLLFGEAQKSLGFEEILTLNIGDGGESPA